MILFKTIQNYV